MSSYHIDKIDKHEHATPAQKLYRKLHALFYKLCGSREAAYPFYHSWRHRRHKPGNKAGEWKHYLTACPAYLAGFGHGLGSWRAGIVNAAILGLEYAYSPMVTPSWDETLGLGSGLPQAKELLRSGYKKVLLPYYDAASEESIEKMRSIIRSYEGRNIVFFNEYEQWTKAGDDIKGDEIIKEMFWNSPRRKQDELRYDKSFFCIALHVRRGDVSSRLSQGDESMRGRWLELGYYADLVKKLAVSVSKKNMPRFYVFSDGKEEDFEELRKAAYDIEFCLDMKEEESFLHLCHADMLLCAPSSFSIIAGAINKNIKLVPDKSWLHYPDTEDWITVSEKDGISAVDMKRIEEVLC